MNSSSFSRSPGKSMRGRLLRRVTSISVDISDAVAQIARRQQGSGKGKCKRWPPQCERYTKRAAWKLIEYQVLGKRWGEDCYDPDVGRRIERLVTKQLGRSKSECQVYRREGRLDSRTFEVTGRCKKWVHTQYPIETSVRSVYLSVHATRIVAGSTLQHTGIYMDLLIRMLIWLYASNLDVNSTTIQ